MAATAWPVKGTADEKADTAALQMAEYLELKKFKQLPSAKRIAESNLRQKEIIQSALAYSPTARELIASMLAAGQDTLAAKGSSGSLPFANKCSPLN